LLFDFAGSSSSLLTKNALHVGQSPLAGALVTGAVGVTSPRHARLDCLYTLWRYLTKLRFRGCDRVRRWLTIHCGCGALACGWPDGSIRFELGVELGLDTVDPLRTRARVTRRHQRSERSRACYDQSLNAHDFASASDRVHYNILGPLRHGSAARVLKASAATPPSLAMLAAMRRARLRSSNNSQSVRKAELGPTDIQPYGGAQSGNG
jgi:hypothetical protein